MTTKRMDARKAKTAHMLTTKKLGPATQMERTGSRRIWPKLKEHDNLKRVKHVKFNAERNCPETIMMCPATNHGLLSVANTP